MIHSLLYPLVALMTLWSSLASADLEKFDGFFVTPNIEHADSFDFHVPMDTDFDYQKADRFNFEELNLIDLSSPNTVTTPFWENVAKTIQSEARGVKETFGDSFRPSILVIGSRDSAQYFRFSSANHIVLVFSELNDPSVIRRKLADWMYFIVSSQLSEQITERKDDASVPFRRISLLLSLYWFHLILNETDLAEFDTDYPFDTDQTFFDGRGLAPHFLARANSLFKQDPILSERFRERALRDQFRRHMKNRPAQQLRPVSGHKLAEVLVLLMADFADATQKERKAVLNQWKKHIMTSANKPDHYVISEDFYLSKMEESPGLLYAFLSLNHTLATFAKQLENDHQREVFRNLRIKYEVTPEIIELQGLLNLPRNDHSIEGWNFQPLFGKKSSHPALQSMDYEEFKRRIQEKRDESFAHWETLSTHEKARVKIESNEFIVNRDLFDYLELLPRSFGETLLNLNSDSLWVDMGSGEGLALEGYLDLQGDPSIMQSLDLESAMNSVNTSRFALGVAAQLAQRPIQEKASTIGITYAFEREAPTDYGDQLKILQDRWFEQIPDHEIGQVDLITDIYGIFAYASEVDDVLRKYLRILKPDGAIYIHYLTTQESQIVSSPDQETGIQLTEWLKTIKGIEVEFSNHTPYNNSSIDAIMIRKTGSEILVPNLEFLSTNHGGPPGRVFLAK